MLPDLDVDAMLAVLATGADRELSPGVHMSQLDHALQTAALLAHRHPGDDELAAAGLVHDIGHLLPGGSDETHADDAARRCGGRWGSGWPGSWGCTWRPSAIWWRPRTATGACSPNDSVVSLQRQGGAMRQGTRRPS